LSTNGGGDLTFKNYLEQNAERKTKTQKPQLTQTLSVIGFERQVICCP